jgi:GT2 family glycosyltransferase
MGAGLAVSVVVPVYGQWGLVPSLLAALTAQSLPADSFEVVIADNETPKPPPSLGLPGNARLVPAPGLGSYAARNAGAAAARGRLLVFTDADCLPDPGWLAALVAAADAAPGALLAGPVRMVAPTAANAFALYDLVRGIPQACYVARGYAATANLAVPAAVFVALGGFDPARRSGGDAAFCRHSGAAGHLLQLVPGATVAHPCRADWAELATKARRIKGGQLTAGPLPRRLAWGLRTLCPPVTDTRAFLAAPHPWRYRLLAVAVRFRLWGVELAEAARLAVGAAPERR